MLRFIREGSKKKLRGSETDKKPQKDKETITKQVLNEQK